MFGYPLMFGYPFYLIKKIKKFLNSTRLLFLNIFSINLYFKTKFLLSVFSSEIIRNY